MVKQQKYDHYQLLYQFKTSDMLLNQPKFEQSKKVNF